MVASRQEQWVYATEASSPFSRYAVAGAIGHIGNPLQVAWEFHRLTSCYSIVTEMTWDNIPDRRGNHLECYEALIRWFAQSDLTFKAMVLDKRRYPTNHKSFTEKNGDTGPLAYLFHFLYRGVVQRGDQFRYHLFLDKDCIDSDTAAILEARLNCIWRPDTFHRSMKQQYCNTHLVDRTLVPCLQLVDLFVGALSERWNSMTRMHKRTPLVKYIEEQVGIDMRIGASVFNNPKFNLWLFKLTRWPLY